MDGKWNSGHGSRSDLQDINIRLEEQSHEFAMDKKRPVNGKLQINGPTVIFKCNNLKSGADRYKLFFIGRKDGNSIYKIIGDIIPDRQGNAELQCKIDPTDIDGEGTDLSCFYIFMVAAMGKPLQMVLKGDLIKQVRKPERGMKPERRTFNGYYSEYILQKIAELRDAAGTYPNISPFDDVWLSDNWKRAADSALLPIASAGAERQIRKYGHFIFGSTEEHFHIGVPGRHTEDEWPDRGRSGFLLWQSIRGSEEYGYWTMVLDMKTGIITEIP